MPIPSEPEPGGQGAVITYYRNYNAEDNTSATYEGAELVSPDTLGFTAPAEHIFVAWNSNRAGTSESYEVGDACPDVIVYAIWESTISEYIASASDLKSVANAIREKSQATSQLSFPDGFVSAIQNIPKPSGSRNVTVSSAGLRVENIRDYVYVNITTPAGTAGIPSATKGTVSNHAVSVTPSVTNSVGWVSSETKSGTPVSVTAAELVSGTLGITQNGTGIDVTNYAAVDVSVSSGGGFNINEIADGTANYGDLVFTGTKIRPYFFSKNLTLTSFTGNNVVSMRGTEFSTTNYSYAFADCTNLTSVSMPNLAVLGSSDYCFAGCTNLESLNIDYFNLETWTTGTLQNCSKLTKEYYVMPCLAGGIWSNALTNNSYIKGIDVGGKAPISSNSWKINTGAFTNNSNLNIIVIRTSKTMALANINALNGTKFASGNAGGTLYVPQSKISDYQSASNWSTILGYANNQIKSIESTHTDPDAPVDLTEYYLDGSHETERSITPYVYDYRKGYVDNNTWRYQDPTDTLCDIYLVCASVEYKISLGSVVGTRFRAMFTDKDVTQTTSNVTGTNIINQNNPAANASVTYTPNKSGYIIVAKDNVGTTGL